MFDHEEFHSYVHNKNKCFVIRSVSSVYPIEMSMDSSMDMFTKYAVEIEQYISMGHFMDIFIEYTTQLNNQSAKTNFSSVLYGNVHEMFHGHVYIICC